MLKKILKKTLKNAGFELKRIRKDSPNSSVDRFVENYKDNKKVSQEMSTDPDNPLWNYFQRNTKGPGIWKWEHYFSIYHNQFKKFIGQKVTVLEIGIYSGGSLEMWKSYFGDKCQVIGVDIEEACRIYENDYTKVLIGDQESRKFWKEFRESYDSIDIVIDDGGHTPEQQRVTLEETLPILNPGGVYLCEDIHGHNNSFGSYVSRLSENLHYFKHLPGLQSQSVVSAFQQSIRSVSIYPYCAVIEKNSSERSRLVAPKHGTQWQPFFDR